MTKKSIRRRFQITVAGLAILLAIGIIVSALDKGQNRLVYGTFKDMMPLVLSMAATWLGYSIQRRGAFQQQLRALWSTLVCAVQKAHAYTHLAAPTQAEYSDALTSLSITIDEFRGVFCNLGESDTDQGYYPFEPVKNIHALIVGLNYGKDFKREESASCRRKIFALWKEVRKEILKEFDREEPTFPHSHWTDLEKSGVYEAHNIEKS